MECHHHCRIDTKTLSLVTQHNHSMIFSNQYEGQYTASKPAARGPVADARGGGGGRGGRLRVAALAGGRAAVRVLGSASLRAGAVGRRRAPSGSDLFPSGAVAGAGGARVRVAAVGAAWRPCVASRLRSLLFARQRRRVRQQDTSRGFSTKCSAHSTSDSNTLPEYPRDPHAMERNAHTACCVRV